MPFIRDIVSADEDLQNATDMNNLAAIWKDEEEVLSAPHLWNAPIESLKKSVISLIDFIAKTEDTINYDIGTVMCNFDPDFNPNSVLNKNQMPKYPGYWQPIGEGYYFATASTDFRNEHYVGTNNGRSYFTLRQVELPKIKLNVYGNTSYADLQGDCTINFPLLWKEDSTGTLAGGFISNAGDVSEQQAKAVMHYSGETVHVISNYGSYADATDFAFGHDHPITGKTDNLGSGAPIDSRPPCLPVYTWQKIDA